MAVSEGFEYRSRDNSAIVIYNMDAGGERPIHGAYFVDEDQGWIPIGWDGQGRVWGDREHPLDIDWENTRVAA